MDGNLFDEWGTDWSARWYNDITNDTQTFLPCVVASQYPGAMNTHIRIRNLGNAATVTVQFYHSTGSVVGTAYNLSIPALQVAEISAAGHVSESYWGQALTAVVYADQPLAVTAHLADAQFFNRHGGYAGLVNGSDQIFFPLLKKNYNGSSSIITIQNIGRTAAQVGVTYYQSNGSGSWTETSVSIPVRGSRTFNLAPVPAGFVGSAVVRCTNNSQIVGAFREEGGGAFLVDVGVDSENTKNRAHLPQVKWRYNLGGGAGTQAQKDKGAPKSSTTLTPRAYLPLVLVHYPSVSSVIQVQNAGTRETTVLVTYRGADGAGPWSQQQHLAAGRACTFQPPVPAGWLGSAVVEAGAVNGTAIEPLAVTVSETGPAAYANYTGFDRGAIELYAPTVCHIGGFVTRIQVQNVDQYSATVSVFYYRDGQTQVMAYHSATIGPGQMHTFSQGTLPEFKGSAKIYCSQLNRKLTATVYMNRADAANDQVWSYSLPITFPELYPIE